jgi:hypothetical protein
VLWSAADEAALRDPRNGRLPCFEDWENLSDVVPITRSRLSGIVSLRSRAAFFELLFFSFACPLLELSIFAEYDVQCLVGFFFRNNTVVEHACCCFVILISSCRCARALRAYDSYR